MAIQGAFGWENSHLFEFIERQSPRATRYGVPSAEDPDEDNTALFDDKKKLIRLSKEIFLDYSDKYKISGLLIFDNTHQYSISKDAAISDNYTIDTVHNTKIKEVSIH
jgi:hypothetical protein